MEFSFPKDIIYFILVSLLVGCFVRVEVEEFSPGRKKRFIASMGLFLFLLDNFDNLRLQKIKLVK